MHRHFTATAFVVDGQGRCLLLWHKRLSRWMPPGGHVDTDELPEETAVRECREETGLDVEIVAETSGEDLFAGDPSEGRMLRTPIAMLLERIPASPERGEEAHEHMDFHFVARPRDASQALQLAKEESTKLRWFTREDVLALRESDEIFSNVKASLLRLLP